MEVTGTSSTDVNGGIRMFRWRIENFSGIKDVRLYSDIFIVGDIKWQIAVFPKGSGVDDCLSIMLVLANSTTFPPGWSPYARFGFAFINQTDRKSSSIGVIEDEIRVEKLGQEFAGHLPHTELHNSERKFLLHDEFLIEAYVSCDKSSGLNNISKELILKSVLGDHEIKEADRVKASSIRIWDEDDSCTFFASLEQELSSSKIVYSKEDVREAMAKIDEAMNMTPADLHSSFKFPPLKHALKVLTSFDCSHAILPIKQKYKLIVMEDKIKQVIDRAAKAGEDKNKLAEKESMKLTLIRNLDRNLRRFKEVQSGMIDMLTRFESEAKHLVPERDEIFQSSKRMKLELEILGKEWGECEANAKVAEQEEKAIESEWRRIRKFVSSIKKKF